MGVMIAAIFGLFLPWLFEFAIPQWPWIAAGVFLLWGIAAPTTLNLVYRTWMRFGLLMSRVTTPIIMGIIYYLVFVPVGLVMQLFGWDPLGLTRDPDASSYRVTSQKTDKSRLEEPF